LSRASWAERNLWLPPPILQKEIMEEKRRRRPTTAGASSTPQLLRPTAPQFLSPTALRPHSSSASCYRLQRAKYRAAHKLQLLIISVQLFLYLRTPLTDFRCSGYYLRLHVQPTGDERRMHPPSPSPTLMSQSHAQHPLPLQEEQHRF